MVTAAVLLSFIDFIIDFMCVDNKFFFFCVCVCVCVEYE